MHERMGVTALPLHDAGNKPIFGMLLIVGIFIVAFGGILFGILHKPSVNPNVLPVTIAITVIVCLTPIPLLRLVRRAGASIENNELVLVTGVGRKRIALSHLRRHGVQVVDLAQHPELQPRIRTWGASMPGFHSGWFRLRNGDKAVCILTDRSRVCYLRSDVDHLSVLLSLQYPVLLQNALESRKA